MRAAVNIFVFLCAAFALPAQTARGEGSGQQGADRFVPSLLVNSGVTGQVWDASVSSEICRGCTFPDPAQERLRPTEKGDDLDLTPFVGGSLELMTPELPIVASPRLFVGAEWAASFGVERKLAREGDPGKLEPPLTPGAPTAFTEDSMLGQGSESIAQMGDYIYGAHAGVAVPFELLGRALRVRTSFAWLHYEIDLKGIVVDAECSPRGTSTNCNPTTPAFPGFARGTSLRASDTLELDGIGPGIDLELDTGRFGPVGSSILAGARVYRMIGDREADFSSPVVTKSDSLGTDENVAHFSFEADEWMYRLIVGIRFQWLGFDE